MKKVFSGLFSTSLLLASVIPVSAAYSDIVPGSTYYDGMAYCVENKIMTGYEDGDFHPGDALSRGQIATILWRLEGNPKGSGSGFNDVPASSFYKAASTWAKSSGLMTGNKRGSVFTFDGEAKLNRQDLATILYRYHTSVKKNRATVGTPLNSYKDKNSVGEWAVTPVNWVLSNGIMSALYTGNFVPANVATRAQTASAIQKYKAPSYKAPANFNQASQSDWTVTAADLNGSWDVDGTLFSRMNSGTNLQREFGSSIRYGVSMTASSAGSMTWYIGAAGGSGSYRISNNVVYYSGYDQNTKKVESYRFVPVVIDGKKYLAQKFGDPADQNMYQSAKPFTVYWYKK